MRIGKWGVPTIFQNKGNQQVRHFGYFLLAPLKQTKYSMLVDLT